MYQSFIVTREAAYKKIPSALCTGSAIFGSPWTRNGLLITGSHLTVLRLRALLGVFLFFYRVTSPFFLQMH